MHTDELQQTADSISTFIQLTLQSQNINHSVIAVSGGIDSALSLTLLTKAIGVEAITPILLPYGDQDMKDAHDLCLFNGFEPSACITIDIQPVVDQICIVRNISATEYLRRGNVMARVRMIMVYDIARMKMALVCGTENKSEHYLGYFTRFGDSASDFEPISQLYKTEVKALAQLLELPANILNKPPSAGLWLDQTDEVELGFTYEQADSVLAELIDAKRAPADIVLPDVDPQIVTAVCDRVSQQSFKRAVPYTME